MYKNLLEQDYLITCHLSEVLFSLKFTWRLAIIPLESLTHRGKVSIATHVGNLRQSIVGCSK